METAIQTDMVYHDRAGQVRVPDEGSIKRGRQGVFALCLSQGYILMIRSEDTMEYYDLPGGGIDEGEKAWEALCREFDEETGLTLTHPEKAADHHQIVGFYANDCDNNPPEFWEYDQRFYVLRGEGIDALYRDESWTTPENGVAQWVPLGDLDDLTKWHYVHRTAIVKILKEQGVL